MNVISGCNFILNNDEIPNRDLLIYLDGQYSKVQLRNKKYKTGFYQDVNNQQISDPNVILEIEQYVRDDEFSVRCFLSTGFEVRHFDKNITIKKFLQMNIIENVSYCDNWISILHKDESVISLLDSNLFDKRFIDVCDIDNSVLVFETLNNVSVRLNENIFSSTESETKLEMSEIKSEIKSEQKNKPDKSGAMIVGLPAKLSVQFRMARKLFCRSITLEQFVKNYKNIGVKLLYIDYFDNVTNRENAKKMAISEVQKILEMPKLSIIYQTLTGAIMFNKYGSLNQNRLYASQYLQNGKHMCQEPMFTTYF